MSGPANSFGRLFCVHTFGESHGPAMGAVIDGCPAGIIYRGDILLGDLERRKPGGQGLANSGLVSARSEPDHPEIVSGLYQGLTLGTPIAVLIRNQDQRSEDYERAGFPLRSGHADDLWRIKFGHSDPRGGGRASGRETVSRVIGGAFAKMFLSQKFPGIQFKTYSRQLGPFCLTADEEASAESLEIHKYRASFPSDRHEEVAASLAQAKTAGESWGGEAQILISGVPAGWGQPVFKKLKSELAMAFFSVGAVAGVEMGSGFAAGKALGTEFHQGQGDYGGLRGGLSTGEPIRMRIAMKPTSSIQDVAKRGRHDPCLLLRALVVFEAMAALVLADQALATQLDRLDDNSASSDSD